MPKFTTYRGMGPGKLIHEVNDKLHINGRVYRTSDLSEIVGKPALPVFPNNSISSYFWSLRMKRGFQMGTRGYNNGSTVHNLLVDFDNGLCGNWAGVTTCGLFIDNNRFRFFNNGNAGNSVVDMDVETGVVSNSEANNPWDAGQADYGIFLPPGPAGAVAMYRAASGSGGASSLETYPAGSTAAAKGITVTGTKTATTSGSMTYHYRVSDHPQRWFFLNVQASTTLANNVLYPAMISKSTLSYTSLSTLSAPAGATALGTGLGYGASVPSYATNSGVNEISSYVTWRTGTNVEIHRVQFAGTDGTPVATNNLVTLDQNPMVTHGVAGTPTVMRTQLVNHVDGNKYLLIFGLEPSNVTPSAAVATMYVFKLTAKDSATFVASYPLAQGPRAHLASDDSGLRFVMVYDDRYEFWTFGAGGILSKVDTIYIQRNNISQYWHAEPYGFDSTGRFWYVTAESQKPTIYTELGLNFYSPPGQVNTISVAFDSDNYTFSGAPVNGSISLSVKDINGAHVAATVNLSPSANVSLSSSTVQTVTSGPVIVPFTINAPGEVTVEAWT